MRNQSKLKISLSKTDTDTKALPHAVSGSVAPALAFAVRNCARGLRQPASHVINGRIDRIRQRSTATAHHAGSRRDAVDEDSAGLPANAWC